MSVLKISECEHSKFIDTSVNNIVVVACPVELLHAYRVRLL